MTHNAYFQLTVCMPMEQRRRTITGSADNSSSSKGQDVLAVTHIPDKSVRRWLLPNDVLEERQLAAVEMVVDDATKQSIVWGPPGTGKVRSR